PRATLHSLTANGKCTLAISVFQGGVTQKFTWGQVAICNQTPKILGPMLLHLHLVDEEELLFWREGAEMYIPLFFPSYLMDEEGPLS
ncbi:hypothetical protein, partial [Pseudomonas syringae group genomosp. 7]|uniref:hypothetical protein n=1 Tax=Pseudomonas syringae group genomosp. 7 TaxID=251699 RepID=UPI001C81634D